MPAISVLEGCLTDLVHSCPRTCRIPNPGGRARVDDDEHEEEDEDDEREGVGGGSGAVRGSGLLHRDLELLLVAEGILAHDHLHIVDLLEFPQQFPERTLEVV